MPSNNILHLMMHNFSKQVLMKVFKYTLFINKGSEVNFLKDCKVYTLSRTPPNLLLYVSIIKLTSIWWVNDIVNNVQCPYPQ